MALPYWQTDPDWETFGYLVYSAGSAGLREQVASFHETHQSDTQIVGLHTKGVGVHKGDFKNEGALL